MGQPGGAAAGRPGPAAARWHALVEARIGADDTPVPGTDEDRDRLLAYDDEVAGSGEDDPFLARVLAAAGPSDTILDVGAGAGRFALPLARRDIPVTAVEPSTVLARRLRRRAAAGGLELETLTIPWERADPRELSAEIVVCAYVLPRIVDVVEFVRRLDACAGRRVLLYLDAGGPATASRVEDPPPPGHRDLLPVLHEVGVTPVCVEVVSRPRAPRARWRTVAGAVVSWRTRS